MFNLEVEGHRYSRISNPTVAVLERRVAELEGGLESLCVSTGQAALNYAVLNLAEMGSNIVSIPQIYGTTHTLFAHILPSQGIGVRFAKTDRADAIEKLIDEKTLAVFCESIGNPAGNICDIEAVAAVRSTRSAPPSRSLATAGRRKAGQEQRRCCADRRCGSARCRLPAQNVRCRSDRDKTRQAR